MFFHWCILKGPVYSLKGVTGNSGATQGKYACVLHFWQLHFNKKVFFHADKEQDTMKEIFFPSIVLVFRHAVVCLCLWGIFSSYDDSLPFDSTKPRAIIIKTGLIPYLTKSTYFIISCLMPVRCKSEIAVEFLVPPPAVQVFTLKNKDWIVCANKRWLDDSGLALHWKALAQSEDFWCYGEHWTIGEVYAITQSSV